jgi:hypothetical protein
VTITVTLRNHTDLLSGGVVRAESGKFPLLGGTQGAAFLVRIYEASNESNPGFSQYTAPAKPGRTDTFEFYPGFMERHSSKFDGELNSI